MERGSHSSSHVTHQSYNHVIFEKKSVFPHPQCQWPPNLVGLRVRVKGPQLLLIIIYLSHNQVIFKK